MILLEEIVIEDFSLLIETKMRFFKTLLNAMQRLLMLPTRPVINGHFMARNDVIKKAMQRKDPK